MTGTVPVNHFLLTVIVHVHNFLLTGTIPVKTWSLLMIIPYWEGPKIFFINLDTLLKTNYWMLHPFIYWALSVPPFPLLNWMLIVRVRNSLMSNWILQKLLFMSNVFYCCHEWSWNLYRIKPKALMDSHTQKYKSMVENDPHLKMFSTTPSSPFLHNLSL